MKKRKKSSKNLSEIIFEIHDLAIKEKRNFLSIFIDLIKCHWKYKSSYKDYFNFEMLKLNQFERKSIITKGINNDFILKYNDPKYVHYFQNKVEFYKRFSKYINRKWIDVSLTNKNEFALFCLNHREVIVKPSVKRNQEKIEKITISEYKLKDLYEELIKRNQTLLEEVITQNKKISKLHPKSVNTIQVITLLGTVVASYIKIGNQQNFTDNVQVGGLIASINIKNGKVNSSAMDKKRNFYECHPITKEKILDFKIPMWDEIIKQCEEAALEIPQVGYLCWTLAVGEDKIYFLEGNDYPNHDLYSLKTINNNVSLLPQFRLIEERKYEE